MKELLKISIAFIAAMVLFVSCKRSGPSTEIKPKVCHTCEYHNFEGVELSNFMKDVARYNNTHVRSLRADPISSGIEASRACWFSLDVIKRFVCLIESEARQQNLSTDDMGIRFYYAVYPSNHKVNGNEYGKLHTLYMVPTLHMDNQNVDLGLLPHVYSKEIAVDVDVSKKAYSLQDLVRMDSRFKVLILHTSSVKDIPSISGRPSSLIQNQGQLCPPTCPVSRNFIPVIDAEYRSESY